MSSSATRQTKKLNIVDRPLGKGRQEVRVAWELPSHHSAVRSDRPFAAQLMPRRSPPPRTRAQLVSQSAFALLFSELIQYSQARSSTASELERRCAPTRPRSTRRTRTLGPIRDARERFRAVRASARRLEEAGEGIGVRVLELCALREGRTRRETRVLGMLQYISGPFWKALFGKAADGIEKVVEADDEYMVSEAEPLVSTYISVPSSLPNLNCAAFTAGIVRGALDASGFNCVSVQVRLRAHAALCPAFARVGGSCVTADLDVACAERARGPRPPPCRRTRCRSTTAARAQCI
jgi:hypothetical protein